MNGLDGIWTIIIALAVATALIRYSFLGLLKGREIPARMRTALEFVPVTVLPALVVPMVVYAPKAEAAVPFQLADPHRLLAALMALAVGVVTRNMVAVVAVGMAAFVGLRAAGL